MNNQKIQPKHLEELAFFFKGHTLGDYGILYDVENQFKEYLGAGTFKFTNSATSALFLILNCLKQNGKKRVVGPSFSHVSWIQCCEWLGLEYKMVDVSAHTLSMDPVALDRHIHEKGVPDVVLYCNMGGYTGVDTQMVRQICDRYAICMIEDSANAFNQKWANNFAGMIGDFGIYSFSSPKLLTTGEGGAVVSRRHHMDEYFNDKIYQGGWYRSDKESRVHGLNFSLSLPSALLLSYQLRDIEEVMADRRDQFLQFKDECEIKNKELWHFPSDNEMYSPSFFCYELPGINDSLADRMKNIQYKRYKSMGKYGKFPVSEKLEKNLVYLPIQ